MSETATLAEAAPRQAEHFDVLIVGAGISGVGGAYHLTHAVPRHELRRARGAGRASAAPGGRTAIPGIRSDSDLYTFGYRFKPWTGAPIATAAEILNYMGEVIEENDLGRHIRYRHKIVVGAAGRAPTNLWTIEATRTDTGEALRFTANFLWMCQGYYRHSEGYTPEWPGMDRFKGRIVHPQTWPEDLDYAGKKVVVIGSGATAATLDPGDRRRLRARHDAAALADLLLHRPQRQRARRRRCASCDIDEAWIHEIVRRKILHEQADVHPPLRSTSRRRCKQELLGGVRALPRARLRRRHALHAALPAVAAAHRLRARRRPVPGHRAPARPRSSPTRSSASPRRGILLKSGEAARGRHHRHRHRLQPQRAGRHRLRDRRQAARLRRHRHLSRHDVHRRAQHGLGVRLLPGQLDAARRPGRRLRLPAAQPHGGEGRAAGRRRRCGRRTRTCRCCPGSTRRTSTPAT